VSLTSGIEPRAFKFCEPSANRRYGSRAPTGVTGAERRKAPGHEALNKPHRPELDHQPTRAQKPGFLFSQGGLYERDTQPTNRMPASRHKAIPSAHQPPSPRKDQASTRSKLPLATTQASGDSQTPCLKTKRFSNPFPEPAMPRPCHARPPPGSRANSNFFGANHARQS